MSTKETKKEHKIDATGRSLGRVASEAATLLMGKNEPSFVRHKLSGNKVVIVNASKLAISQKKMDEKEYTRHSGYPGSLRKETLGSFIKRRGYGEALRKAVRGMLPDNKLRPEMLKNLEITE